ncbi:MAG: hypothetical protein MPJ24_08945, partial [Pirellulaceae bacterium]|nr:hypothetical protein [Pirellulaceae bacterium]
TQLAVTAKEDKLCLYINDTEILDENKSVIQFTNFDCATWIGATPPGSPVGEYMRGLSGIKGETDLDYRPFGGEVTYNPNRTNGSARRLLSDYLGNTTTSVVPDTFTAPVSFPSTLTTYRLYPGGPSYTIPNFNHTYGSTIHDQTIGPDVLTNPLGVYHGTADLTFANNVTFSGILINPLSTDSIQLNGTNIVASAPLIPLDTETTTYAQIPVLSVGRDFLVGNHANVKIEGMVVSGLNFHIGSGSRELDFTGKVASQKIDFQTETNWANLMVKNWIYELREFYGQTAISHFPEWMETKRSLSYEPSINFHASPENIRYHWPDWSVPIFTTNADGKLDWKILRIIESN